ncbi:Pol polyprotein [Plakobranchus ocellatus]|uniref:Pol polyprotein n=1 Tax=Plakobranchus ocellatus TaxID=259542 RepID=A0AAV4C8V2_9GAST|nr:Pol polyprotein [Plakobranchus ocellatus]
MHRLRKKRWLQLGHVRSFQKLIGTKPFVKETDHKPLVSFLKKKGLDELTLRLQRFRMRLMRFSYEAIYVHGKNLFTADTFSRTPYTMSHMTIKKRRGSRNLCQPGDKIFSSIREMNHRTKRGAEKRHNSI